MKDTFQAIPYCGAAPAPAEFLGRWNGDLVLLCGIGIALVAMFLLVRDPKRQQMAGSALATFALLYISPLCALGSALFSARIVHHLVLILFMAPLVAHVFAGMRRPGSLGLWTALQAVVLWLWHWPLAYTAALSHSELFWLMQASILGVSAGFWRALWDARTSARIPALVATMMQMSLLGALIAFANAPLYPPHYLSTLAWGLTPLDDQRLAGLLMWIPAGLVYLAGALLYAARVLQERGPLTPAQLGVGRSV